jgi:SAM-dependent methyltransferase
MGHLNKYFGANPRVLDVGCGAGLMSYLLAERGCNVIGIDDGKNPHWEKFKHPNLSFRVGDFREFYKDYQGDKVDVVYCSWMPPNALWSPLFYKRSDESRLPGLDNIPGVESPMVIHVIGETPEIDEETKKPKERDVDNNDYTDSRRTVTGLLPDNDSSKWHLIDLFGSPYKISQDHYTSLYDVLDAWKVVDFRTVEQKVAPQMLSKVRVDILKSLKK